MKVRVVCRKVYDYIRYDLREIAFPSSLPDPPGTVYPRKLTLKEKFFVLKKATRLYCASWVRDIGPELHPDKYKKKQDEEDLSDRVKDDATQEKDSALEDLAVAAKGGMETLRPALQRVYMTRASAYRDALKSFIKGYQQGIKEVLEKKDDVTSQQQGSTDPNKST